MREKELQEKAIFGGMTEEGWEEFYAKSEDEQDAFCRARLRTLGLSRSYERDSYDFQYQAGDVPSFRKVCLLTENDEKFTFKADDFLEFHVEKIEPCMRSDKESAMYHGVFMRIKKSANKDLVDHYITGQEIRDRLFERLISWSDIYSISIDQVPFCDVEFQDCPWAAEAMGCSVADDMNGGQLTFLDEDGNLVIYIE